MASGGCALLGLEERWDACSHVAAHRQAARVVNPGGALVQEDDLHVTRMMRAKKWMNLSTRRFEKIFGRIDETREEMTHSFHGLGMLRV